MVPFKVELRAFDESHITKMKAIVGFVITEDGGDYGRRSEKS